MEYLLHYTWKHRLFPFGDMVTTHGDKVEVMSVGMHNSDGGPDFIGARLKIGGVEWAGNVEIHMRSSDWYRHHHDTDAAYDTVVLHVVGEADCEVYTHSGVCLPQLVLRVPDEVNENYERLNHADSHPRCQAVLRLLPRVSITSWLSSLCVERLHSRVDQLDVRRGQLGQSWEDVAFVTVARNFGFGKNGDAFERWAMALSTSAMNKHRDDLFQVEALFFGTAGLLAAEADASMPDYYRRLQAEWKYLSRKFGLKPIDATAWQFLRMRPQNFPYTRIAQLAMLYHDGCLGMSRIMGAQNVEELMPLFDTSLSHFWQTHYTFSSEPVRRRSGQLSDASKRLIILNSVVPLLFAYGRYRSDTALVDRALSLLDELPAESNHITRQWQQAGVECRSAADSQALYQLTTRYCEAKDCLHCRFGHEYMRQNPGFLKEKREDEK